MVTIVYPHLDEHFPYNTTDSPTLIKLAVTHLMRLPAPNYAVTVNSNDNQKWTLWMSDECFKHLQQLTNLASRTHRSASMDLGADQDK